MPNITVSWEDNALDLLDERDRYTRNAIRQEFRRDPKKDAIELDPVEHTFLTPVSDRKFSVVWRLSQDNAAIVRAVVPLPNVTFDVVTLKEKPEALTKLREYVQRVVKTESKGEILL
jgi:hypothetical protein